MQNPHALSDEERLWGMLAHLLTLLGYVVGLGQYIAPLVIYLVYQERSKFVAFHALQALYFQLLLIPLWVLLFVFSMITCGFGSVLFVIPPVISLVYALIAGIRANQGEWYDLPIVGAWARNTVGA